MPTTLLVTPNSQDFIFVRTENGFITSQKLKNKTFDEIVEFYQQFELKENLDWKFIYLYKTSESVTESSIEGMNDVYEGV